MSARGFDVTGIGALGLGALVAAMGGLQPHPVAANEIKITTTTSKGNINSAEGSIQSSSEYTINILDGQRVADEIDHLEKWAAEQIASGAQYTVTLGNLPGNPPDVTKGNCSAAELRLFLTQNLAFALNPAVAPAMAAAAPAGGPAAGAAALAPAPAPVLTPMPAPAPAMAAAAAPAAEGPAAPRPFMPALAALAMLPPAPAAHYPAAPAALGAAPEAGPAAAPALPEVATALAAKLKRRFV